MSSKVTYAEILAKVAAGLEVTSDSRQVQKGSVFVAVRGENEDGGRYIPNALEAGARYIVAERVDEETRAQIAAMGATLIEHENSRVMISELASAYYKTAQHKMQILGVTGTNGKTTCAYLLEHLFTALGEKVGVMGTVSYRWPGHCENAPLTTPGPVQVHANLAAMAQAGCTKAIMEVSSHALEQQRVLHVPFAGACFTNLTQDHLDFHKDMASYFAAKQKLFTQTPKQDKATAINADDEWGLKLARSLAHGYAYGFEPCPQGLDPQRYVQGTLLEHGVDGVGLRMQLGEQSWELHSPLIGRFNADNLLTVQTLALALGCSIQDLQALADFHGVPGRLERVRNAQGLHAFVDYAHTPDALINVLNALRGAGFKRIVTVFGCGGNRDRTKRPLMGKAVAELSDVAVVTSDNPRFEEPEAIIQDILPGLEGSQAEVVVEVDRAKATKMACAMLGKDDCLLIAGKGHEDYQIVAGVKRHYSDQETLRALLG